MVVRGWAADSAWNDAVVGEAAAALPYLEDVLAAPTGDADLPDPERLLDDDWGEDPADVFDPGVLTIDQSSTQAWPHSTGALWPRDGRLPVAEGPLPPGAVSVPLARSWYPADGPVGDAWLREGLAAWIGYRADRRELPRGPGLPRLLRELRT